MTVNSYRDLLVWQRSMDLVVACYRLTDGFPRREMYGITSQIRRAAVSVPSNIAEGHGRYHTGDFHRHLSFANGPRCELESQLILAERLGFASADAVANLLEAAAEVGRTMHGLSTALERKMESAR